MRLTVGFARPVLAAIGVASLLAVPAAASPRSDAVLDALRVGELLAIMQIEAEASGAELDAQMLGGSGGRAWAATVSQIHDADRVENALREAFAERMPDDEAERAQAFFTSDQGARIIELEISAREALLEPAIEEMNRDAARAMRDEGSARFDLIRRFVEVNNLVDANVAGGLAGNVAFLRGLRDGGFAPYARSSDDALFAEAWASEPEMRRETEDWVYGFLSLAYGPLEDSDLEAYIAFSETEAGQTLNDALFSAFNSVFAEGSHALGSAMARHLSAEDI